MAINNIEKGLKVYLWLLSLLIIMTTFLGCKGNAASNNGAKKYSTTVHDTITSPYPIAAKVKPTCCKGAPSRMRALSVIKKEEPHLAK
jgi:hypothetical protein